MKLFKTIKKNLLENADGICYTINTMFGGNYYPNF